MKQKTRIGIDGNEANVLNRVGSNKIAYEILKHLCIINKQIKYTIYLKDKPLHDMPFPTKNWQYRCIKPKIAWTQWRLPLGLYLNNPRPNIFFSPGHYAPRFSPIPTVVTILDLSFIKFPNLFLKHKRGVGQLKRWTAYSVKNASQVIAISENTKRDILETYHVNPKKIHVIYPGIDHQFYSPQPKSIQDSCQKKYNLPDNFILHVGTIQPRKNLIRLIKSFENLPTTMKKTHLVLAGQSGWLNQEVDRAVRNSKKSNQIHTTGFVEEQDMPGLYSKAACLAFIGLYEGFGFPAAEAISCGTLPVVSSTASLPEVVGKSGITVDPYSVKSITHGLATALSEDCETKQKRLSEMNSHIQKFNWQNSAKSIQKILIKNSTSS